MYIWATNYDNYCMYICTMCALHIHDYDLRSKSDTTWLTVKLRISNGVNLSTKPPPNCTLRGTKDFVIFLTRCFLFMVWQLLQLLIMEIDFSRTFAALVVIMRRETTPSNATIGKYENPGIGIFPGSLMHACKQNIVRAVIPPRNNGK